MFVDTIKEWETTNKGTKVNMSVNLSLLESHSITMRFMHLRSSYARLRNEHVNEGVAKGRSKNHIILVTYLSKENAHLRNNQGSIVLLLLQAGQ